LDPALGHCFVFFIIRPCLLFIQITEILTRVTSSSVSYSDVSGLGSLADIKYVVLFRRCAAEYARQGNWC
jgi:hypothetical protein